MVNNNHCQFFILYFENYKNTMYQIQSWLAQTEMNKRSEYYGHLIKPLEVR